LTYENYRAKYDELWNQGWRLKLLDVYVVNGQPLYTAVWRPSTEGEIQVYGWSYNDFRNKYDELWNQGWRLKLLDVYVVNGQPLYTAVWHSSEEVYTVHIHAIKTADDDGSRPADINADEVRQWVDRANQAFAPAHIRFELDPIPDDPNWLPLRNTLINNLDPSGGTDAFNMANSIASRFPDKLVVFFRHGYVIDAAGVRHDDWHTGNAFSGRELRFIAMPGFSHTGVVIGQDTAGWIWAQNIWQLSHDIGHYLDLAHTFSGACEDTETPTKAAAYIASHGGLASALDGDGLSDTPPEACTSFYITQNWNPCIGHDSYTITGVTNSGMPFSYDFVPNRHNMMSYFACEPMDFTSMQIDKMREELVSRNQEGLSIR
jgi:Bacterial tandem repeat domain 1/Pregnancy-associated plasma protein-A